MIQEAGYSYCLQKLIDALAAAFKTERNRTQTRSRRR
jgi:hypothetical protein